MKKKRVAIIGPVGMGKSLLALCLFCALFHKPGCRGEVSRPWLSRRLRKALRALKKHHQLPERTPEAAWPEAGQPGEDDELLSFVWHAGDEDVLVEILCLAGEDLYIDGQLDPDALKEQLRTAQIDLVLATVNPHELSESIGLPALSDLVVTWLRLGYSLGESIDLGSQLLFGRNRQGLLELHSDLDKIPPEVLDLKQSNFKRRVRDLGVLLRKEGLSEEHAAQVLRVLGLVARTVADDHGDLATLHEVAREFPLVITMTHIDLVGFLPSLHESDYLPLAETIWPTERDPLVSDVVLAKNLHLELRKDATPVFVRGVLPDGGVNLWHSIKLHFRRADAAPARHQFVASPAASGESPRAVSAAPALGAAAAIALGVQLAMFGAASLFGLNGTGGGTFLSVVGWLAGIAALVLLGYATALSFGFGRREPQASAQQPGKEKSARQLPTAKPAPQKPALKAVPSAAADDVEEDEDQPEFEVAAHDRRRPVVAAAKSPASSNGHVSGAARR